EIVAGPEAIKKRCLYSENSQACDNPFTDSLQSLWKNEQDVTNDCGKPFNGTMWRKENRCCINYSSSEHIPLYYCKEDGDTAELYLGDWQQYQYFGKVVWLFKWRDYSLWDDNYAMPSCVCTFLHLH
ncbi:MAG: hypothetical protein ACP5O3_03560, partial [Candidatus Micrarchaeia archaeon]